MDSLQDFPATSTPSAGCVMRDMVHRAERFYPDKTAVVCGTGRWTYREFGTRVRKLASAFSNLGIHKGDRVAVLMLNCHRYLEVYAACFELGILIVPLNMRLAASEAVYTVNDAEAIAVVMDETFLPFIEGIRSSLKTVRTYLYTGSANNLPASVQEYEQLLREANELQEPPAVHEADLAGLFYTSGTTGHAKGVMLTNRNLCANALQGLTVSMLLA